MRVAGVYLYDIASEVAEAERLRALRSPLPEELQSIDDKLRDGGRELMQRKRILLDLQANGSATWTWGYAAGTPLPERTWTGVWKHSGRDQLLLVVEGREFRVDVDEGGLTVRDGGSTWPMRFSRAHARESDPPNAATIHEADE